MAEQSPTSICIAAAEPWLLGAAERAPELPELPKLLLMMHEPLLLLLALARLAGAPQVAKEQLVAAVYFGDWHADPQMSAVHGANWTEFQLPIHATPRYPGHLQPNVPLEVPETFGLGAPENQPAVMSRKIAAAVEHGVGMFLFDWYWYASPTMGRVPDLQGAGGGPFLDGAQRRLPQGAEPRADEVRAHVYAPRPLLRWPPHSL
eukprot:COSAG04_NODE_5203_length_1704_cov_1.554517_2_plen_205_part_00